MSDAANITRRRSALTTEQAENNLLDAEIVFSDATRDGDEAKAAVSEALRFNAATSLTAARVTRRRAW